MKVEKRWAQQGSLCTSLGFASIKDEKRWAQQGSLCTSLGYLYSFESPYWLGDRPPTCCFPPLAKSPPTNQSCLENLIFSLLF